MARNDDGPADDGAAGEAAIRVRLDELFSERGMTLTELAARVEITIVNLCPSSRTAGHGRSGLPPWHACARPCTPCKATCSATSHR